MTDTSCPHSRCRLPGCRGTRRPAKATGGPALSKVNKQKWRCYQIEPYDDTNAYYKWYVSFNGWPVLVLEILKNELNDFEENDFTFNGSLLL